MKMVVIAPVAKPKSFSDVKFTEDEWKKATKGGALTMPMVTAMANIKNSKGLYKIQPLPSEIAATPKLPDPTEMTSAQIAQELAAYGKAPQKQMARSKAIEFLRELREKSAAMIVDDEDE